VSRAPALAALALALPCAAASASSADVWAKLHRPLHLPVVAAGAACPVSKLDTKTNFAKYGVGRGIGRGPAYPIGSAFLRFSYPPDPRSDFGGGEWSGTKVLWFVAPRYRGPVLIRGARLDAADELRFDRGVVPPTELRIKVGEQGGYPPGFPLVGQRYRPSYTRLRAAGCYAYQVDGTSFSYAVVFRAEVSS
jgi:hypothetical protein